MLTALANTFLPRTRAATVQQLGHPRAGILGWANTDDSSGVAVTEDTALNYAAWWCGVRILSETVASLPCILYRGDESGNKERARDDSRYTLVHDAPNEEVSAYTFFETEMQHVVSWGNCYAKVVRDGMNDPVAMEIRLPDRTVPRRNISGQLVYHSQDPREEIERPDMLHVPGLGFDGLVGYSVIAKAAQSLGIVMAADRYAGSFFKNGAVPSGVLEHPMRLDKPARETIRREWDEIHGTPSKSNRLAILHGGMKYTPIQMSNEDAQFLESRQFSVSEIARWLRVPPHMLADLKNSAVRANIEQQAIEFVIYSLRPWLRRFETNLNRSLLRKEERRSMFFEFLLDALLRGDITSRYSAYSVARQWGWLSVNEIRRLENMNTLGEEGDVHLQPLNMAPAGTPPPQSNAEVPSAIAAEFSRSVEGMVARVLEQGSQIAAEQHDIKSAVAEADERLCQKLSGHRELTEGVKRDLEQLGQSVSVRVPEAIERITGAVPASVRDVIAEHDTAIAEAATRASQVTRTLLSDSLRVALRIEAAEAIKAARGQVHDKSQNFVSRVDSFYDRHSAKVYELISGPVQASCDLAWTITHESQRKADELLGRFVATHVERSKQELLACADGLAEQFEARVKACADSWLSNRVTSQTDEYHAEIFGTVAGGV